MRRAQPEPEGNGRQPPAGPLLVTGSEGLIGRPLRARLRQRWIAVRDLDLRGATPA